MGFIMLNIPDILIENTRRKAELFAPYDPVLGTGSPLDRYPLIIDENTTHNIPIQMMEVDWIRQVDEAGGLVKSMQNIEGLTEELIIELWGEYVNIRCKYDFEYWAATQAHIKDKETGTPVLFVLNKPQRRYLKQLEDLRLNDQPIRIVILKARQWGGSTLTQIYMLWIQTFWKMGWSSVVCADVKDKAKHIRGMFSYLAKRHNIDIAKITLQPYQQSQEHKQYTERDCMIGVGSAENPTTFNAYSFYMAHLSEIGLYKKTAMTDPKELVQSIASVVPDLPYTLIVKESTARGVGTLFHDEWIKSENGTSGYAPVFVSWFADPRNVLPISNLTQFVKTMTPKDWERWEKGATLEGIHWYNEQKRKENFDDVSMGENFPTDPQEAFMSSGRRAFQSVYVNRARKTCCDPIFVGDIYGDSMKGKEALNNIHLEEKPNGELRVWLMPDKEPGVTQRGCVTVDIGGRTQGADWSVIKGFDRVYQAEGGVPEVAFVWAGHMDQDLVSWKAAQLGMLWYKSLLIVEVNSLDSDEDSEGDHAMTILDEIAEFYPNLYARVDPEKVKLGAPVLYGFHNNKKTRPMIIDDLNGALRDQMYIEHDSRACDEMDWFVMSNKGKYEAQEGKNDDMVITTALGTWACNSYMDTPHVINKEAKKRTGRAVSEATM
jgi:hypothetical protein